MPGDPDILKPKFSAYTDASVSEAGQATGAILVCALEGKKKIESLHVVNYGQSGILSNKAELDTKILALHRLPAFSLVSLFSDSSATVDMLQAFRKNQPKMKGLHKVLSEEEVKILDEGIKRQPVSFQYLPRENDRMRIVDHFCRYARRQPVGVTEIYLPPSTFSLHSQIRTLTKAVINANVNGAELNLDEF